MLPDKSILARPLGTVKMLLVTGMILVPVLTVIYAVKDERKAHFDGDIMDNIRLAGKHSLEFIQPIIVDDPRFANVRIACTTQGNGSLIVGGSVGSAADLTDLKAIIESSAPPRPVVYGVRVGVVATERSSAP
jgi:hypothetical protein